MVDIGVFNHKQRWIWNMIDMEKQTNKLSVAKRINDENMGEHAKAEEHYDFFPSVMFVFLWFLPFANTSGTNSPRIPRSNIVIRKSIFPSKADQKSTPSPTTALSDYFPEYERIKCRMVRFLTS